MGKPRTRGNGAGTVWLVKGGKPRTKPWAAAVTVGWTLDGKPIRKARYASSQREAKNLLAEMVAARDHARPLPDDRMTVGKWLRTWAEDLPKRELRPNTIANYRWLVSLVLPDFGSLPLRRLRATDVEAVLTRYREQPHTMAALRAVLSTAIRDAQRQGWVATNEAALARGPKTSRKAHPAPTPDEVRAVLAALEDHRLHALYVLLAGTGLRIGEATGLRWEDISNGSNVNEVEQGLYRRSDAPGAAPGVTSGGPDNTGSVAGRSAGVVRRGGAVPQGGPTTLTVRYQLQRINGEHVLTDPKTDAAGRTVHLPARVSAALAAHRVRQATERLAAGRKWRQTDLVFTTPTGQPVAETTAQWVLAAACKRAGVRHVSPHDLRRFVASEVEAAIGRDAAQLVLGHTAPRMTAKYLTVRDSTLSKAADALEEAL